MDVPPDTEYIDGTGRPVPIVYNGTPIPDLKDLDLAKFGIEPVSAKKDPKTGFIVGGTNPTSLLRDLTEINGRSIAALEADMRPDPKGSSGVTSMSGFLGPEESLLEVLAADNSYVVDELRLTHQQLARPLHVLGVLLYRGVEPFKPTILVYHGRRIEIEIWASKGHQLSPFYDDTAASSEVVVKNLHNGKSMRYSLLVPHMMERYGFYEGKGTRYRVEPRRIVEVFDFLIDDRVPVEGRLLDPDGTFLGHRIVRRGGPVRSQVALAEPEANGNRYSLINPCSTTSPRCSRRAWPSGPVICRRRAR